MNVRTKLGILAPLVIILAAALMQVSLLRIGGVSPNVVLVSLIVFSFFTENPLFYVAIVLLAALFVRATPVIIDPVATTTAALALAVFFLQRRVVWPGLIGTGILVAITTPLTYLFIEPNFLLVHPGLLFGEIIYNIFIGLILFEIIKFFFGSSIRS